MTDIQEPKQTSRTPDARQTPPAADDGLKRIRGPNWRRVVGALALVAALVLLIKQWNRTRKVDLTLVVIQTSRVRSVTVRLFDPRAKKGSDPIREVHLEGNPGSEGRTFSVPAGRYLLVLQAKRMDGSIQRTKRRLSLSADAKLTLHVR